MEWLRAWRYFSSDLRMATVCPIPAVSQSVIGTDGVNTFGQQRPFDFNRVLARGVDIDCGKGVFQDFGAVKVEGAKALFLLAGMIANHLFWIGLDFPGVGQEEQE